MTTIRGLINRVEPVLQRNSLAALRITIAAVYIWFGALKISGHGLARRARVNASDANEAVFLEPLIEFVEANQTPAERKLELFHGKWNGSVDPLFAEFAY